MLRGLYVAALLLMLLCAAEALAQYGTVDPAESSERVLRDVFATKDADRIVRALNEWDLTGWQGMLPKFLGHENPNVQIAAVVMIGHDETADLPAALGELDEPAQRTVAVRELMFTNALSAENAQAIQDTVEIEPILQAMLYSVDRTLEAESATKTLEELTNNTEIPLFARGVAASELAERGEEAPLQAWMNEVDQLPENTKSRVLYELTLLSNQLDSPRTANVLLMATSTLPPDDLLRAAATVACLRLTPETGIPAWKDLMLAAETVSLRSALAMIVLEIAAEVPQDALEPLNDGPPFHQMLLTLVETPPESRLEGALGVIQHGHLPSMQWAILEASSQVERPDSIAVFNAILDKAQANPRPAFLELASKAAKILATIDPESIAARIARTDSPIMKEILFSALAMAGTPEAAASATELLKDPALANRSMALLVVACSEKLDEQQIKLLGRASAGGGRLPAAMRPVAAWVYLHQTDSLEPAISRIFAN